MKKRLKKFFTLQRKRDGFTLVELIIVIAVLAILAGAGTVGYSGYIKQANKKSDMVLVGNIMRAIETGTNSTMFAPEESFGIGVTTYPVGFILLTESGIQVLTSGTEVSAELEPCVFETATVKKLTSASVKKSCGLSSHTETVTTITDETIKYCTVHGSAPTLLSTATEYITAFNGCTSSGWIHSHNWSSNIVRTTLPAGTMIADSSLKYQSSSNSSLCEYAYANQYGSFVGENKVNTNDTNNVLYKSLEAAFGNLSGLKLKWESWGKADKEGHTLSTFYAYSPALMGKLEDLSNTLASLGPTINSLKPGFVYGTYEDGGDVLDKFSAKFTELYGPSVPNGKELWLEQWRLAATINYGQHSFGFDGMREFYSGCRKAYSSSFASYLSANGIAQTYTNVVAEFYTDNLLVMNFPGAVNTSAFTTEESGLKKQFYDAGDRDYTVFNQCAELFEIYKDSKACEENGIVFYETMVTVNETFDVASDNNNASGGDVFAYYQGYLNEMATLYKEVQTKAGTGIIISVSVENGIVKCEISPNAANPRK